MVLATQRSGAPLAARAARLRGDVPEAEAQLEQCLKLQGGSRDAVQLEYLLLQAQTDETDDVRPILLQLVDRNHPESALILETLARADLNNLRFGTAMAYLERWIQIAPDAGAPFFWRGWARERLNFTDEELEDLQRAVELEPDRFQFRLRLAERYLEVNRATEALPHLERLRAQNPQNPAVMARLGYCRFLLRQEEEARALMETAVAQLPEDPPLLLHLANLELEEKRPVEAEKWLQRLLKIDPHNQEALNLRVRCLREQGLHEEAAAALAAYEKSYRLRKRASDLLKKETSNESFGPGPPAELGSLLLSLGQERLALYWLSRALKRDPDYKPAHQALAEYYASKGNQELAASHRHWLTAGVRKEKSP